MYTEAVVVHTEGLCKSYDTINAVNSLDLNIKKNTIVGFLGPNGAGKTTTIKLLLGLTRPTSGNATVFGHDIVTDSIEIRKRVGYLAQDPCFYDYMTARETLRFVARFYFSGPQQAIEQRVNETLANIGLEHYADRPIRGFSTGERQRLGIGQACINSPDLLILDEPAASLDPMGRRDVLELLRELRHQTTIIYSTHILDDVQRVSDMVAIINRGHLVSFSPIEQLLSGNNEIVYSLVIRGDASQAQASVSSQPWVSSIDVTSNNGQTIWQVKVTDDKAAEEQLLPLIMANGQMTVCEFKRKEYELEEVFMQILDGSDND
jgi:ABC-2 type transport system ATP-binding protein